MNSTIGLLLAWILRLVGLSRQLCLRSRLGGGGSLGWSLAGVCIHQVPSKKLICHFEAEESCSRTRFIVSFHIDFDFTIEEFRMDNDLTLRNGVEVGL